MKRPDDRVQAGRAMRIHLDTLGGIAGDMFIAAMLDAFPEHEAGMLASIDAMAPLGVRCTLLAHHDGVFHGRRFEVVGPEATVRAHAHPAEHEHHHHHHHHDHDHDHVSPHVHGESWRSIRTRLEASALAPAVRTHAIAIFGHLAQAEARVHGVAVEDVGFHEVGAWDSIADIVGAAHLIAAVAATRWSVSALPLGSGRVRTAHGLMPVPAPATALLLAGFAFIDDGAPGERVTPTGAAILRHLCDPSASRDPTSATLGRSGVGFGARRLPGVSNCLRVLAFEDASAPPPSSHRELLVVEFEVDDQSAEDLALGLDRLRDHADIFDAVQSPVFGKKGRMMTSVRLLAREGALGRVVEAVFRETTTIGLRHHVVGGAALPRSAVEVGVGDQRVRVKTVERPGGRTAKAEADDARGGETHAARAALRRRAESLALHGSDAT